jgi:hypothetical protein
LAETREREREREREGEREKERKREQTDVTCFHCKRQIGTDWESETKEEKEKTNEPCRVDGR